MDNGSKIRQNNPDFEQARELARSHSLRQGQPRELDSYRKMSELPGWMERIRRYCQHPHLEHNRAADWFLDNNYQVTRAIRQLREDLPANFYAKLQPLESPDVAGIPRAYALANALLDRLQPKISKTGLVDYLLAYQEVSPLTYAELWALPSMLRLACIERLVHGFHKLNPKLDPAFSVSQLVSETRHQDSTEAIAAALTNLIAVNAIKWENIVDRTSCIEAKFLLDPAGIYPSMTFETRDRYRKVVENLAERSRLTEIEVSKETIRLALENRNDPRKGHVGYWLIDDGQKELEKIIGYRPKFRRVVAKKAMENATQLYFMAQLAGLIVAMSLPVAYLLVMGASVWQVFDGILLSLLPATALSLPVTHWLITALMPPRTLPEMNFSDGIPEEFATAIVIPVILKSPEEVALIGEKLEIRWLSNPDPMLRFVVLSDLTDSDTETDPGDAEVIQALTKEIRRLNARFEDGKGSPFSFMHRARTYNFRQQCWMARERKRGKLEDFNCFVLQGDATPFPDVEGDTESLRAAKFAIVLDADTDLPPTTAARMIGVLAHPLNRAQIDRETGRVTAGYSLVQPRIDILSDQGKATRFSHLYAGDTAIDIYSHAASDLYQDLFGSGIFVGKGIYDIAALHQSLSGRIPENSILSHDLFEGLHARSALASNIVLYEDFPATYPEYAARMHRWIRGDWQLLPWLTRQVPTATGDKVESPLSHLDRWKILDNMRRSLVPASLMLFFIAGWTLFPGNAAIWMLLALAAPGSYLIGDIYALLTGGIRRGFIGDTIHRFADHGGRWFMAITFLVSDTIIGLDAIGRTIWRLSVSKQNLLEWTSAAHETTSLRQSTIRAVSWKLMWPSTAVSAALAGYLALYDQGSFLFAVPILALWIFAPEIAVRTSQRRILRREVLNDGERHFLTAIARRTWYFFETFTGPEDNWLPPDNFQEYPQGLVAHRTSPTNIGMFLTSAQSAHDLGFITTTDLLVRCRNTIDTLDRLKTHRGHILNWYDTRTLEPLEPRYISTVDSGNLAISLIAMKTGCSDAENAPAVDPRNWEGLRTILDLLISSVRRIPVPDADALDTCQSKIEAAIHDAQADPSRWRIDLSDLSGVLLQELEQVILDSIGRISAISNEDMNEIHVWLGVLQHHLHAMQRDIDHHLPWMSLLSAPPIGQAELADRIAKKLAPSKSIWQTQDTVAACQAEISSALAQGAASVDAKNWLAAVQQAISEGAERQADLAQSLTKLGQRCGALAYGMDFTFLYDPEVRLFHVGYNDSVGQMDHSHYDLLATEARLASFFAISKHDVPIKHWYAFGRPITRLQGKPSVLSWNGSMFEYLMPPIFLPSNRDTLLGESEVTAIDYQRQYAAERGVPWGISESAFGVTDASNNYQYRAFGVPGLGLRRGLTDDLVVTPYATALALCARPSTAVENLRRLDGLGAVSCYGFWDALDYTPARLSGKGAFVPVKTYMAHHQGMILCAIVNALKTDIHVRRVMAEKNISAVDLLLQERVPWEIPIETGRIDESWEAHDKPPTMQMPSPWIPSTDTVAPQMHLLGNGHMSARVSASGAGGLIWNGNMLTRWRPDPTRDCHGIWLYLQDAVSSEPWSVGYLPTHQTGQDSKVVFHQHMIETFRRDREIATRQELVIAPYDNVEIRRITLINEGDTPKDIKLTTYGEVVLEPALDEERHPAFSKLFVGSTFLSEQNAMLFERRPRRPETKPPVLLHALVSDDPGITLAGYETDRGRFIGRGRTMRDPQGLETGLSGTTGFTLDPVFALQVQVRLEPMEGKSFAVLTVAGTTRHDVLKVASRYPEHALGRTFREASLETAREVNRLDLSPGHLPEVQVLSSLLLQPSAPMREVPEVGPVAWQGQPDLWRLGLSGDLPILLLLVDLDGEVELLEILLRAQRLWRRRGLQTDLVVLQTGVSTYENPLRERILSILHDSKTEGYLGRNGGIHLLWSDQMDSMTRDGIIAAAHVVLKLDGQSLDQKLDRALAAFSTSEKFESTVPASYKAMDNPKRPDGLLFDNGYGGFDAEAGEYVMHLTDGMRTPAPWCNVLSNDSFGTITSSDGLGFTWAVNSGEHRLTPWTNDPVLNTPTEVLYLRDEMTAEVWSPTPAPMNDGASCQIRHGTGYTIWSRNSHELEQELLAFVPKDAPVKLMRLRLKNTSNHVRRVTATFYAEWLLGALETLSKPHIACHYDATLKAIIAGNRWNPEFGDRVAFVTASVDPHSLTGDRRAFLGRHGDTSDPEALRRSDLGGRFTPGGDACAGYQVHLDIEPGKTEEVVFVLGEAADGEVVNSLILEWRDPARADAALRELRMLWKRRLGAVQVKTPDPAFDLMVNQWLPYQNLSCRILARAAFYQASGAFGFRDQLQDVLALLFTDPDRARQHILRAARRQFEEGDALHWWHPPQGRGVRTRCSDDYLWLVYVTARYVAVTDDSSILDEEVPFLSAPELRPEEYDRYAQFDEGASASLFEHCARALDRMMAVGQHGLPLIGTGDWNDGMDRIGDEGAGESVWLAWFEIATVSLFAPLAEKAGNRKDANRWRRHTRKLRSAIAENAWDGDWYMRAFDDKGIPWGSGQNDECRIDLIAQAWSVLSDGADADRAQRAMRSACENLVDTENRLIRLLDPPFFLPPRDPGYIQAYPPGIRENGGQYTHAAAWLGLAFAQLGDGDRAWQVFDIINPIRRSADKADALHYLREPYVLAGDVSGTGALTGQGGWSWYTGAAGWAWQLAVHGILGAKLNANRLSLDPCLPLDWGGANLSLEGPNGRLAITIEDPDRCGHGVVRITVDGKVSKAKSINFPGAGKIREIVVRLGPAKS
ncbi:MAG: cellobiose phosphorylase [Thermodesulfovibrionia bacterium]|nr:cellobiose phosphorylase [Thermodesulfovibrionia bacterium]